MLPLVAVALLILGAGIVVRAPRAAPTTGRQFSPTRTLAPQLGPARGRALSYKPYDDPLFAPVYYSPRGRAVGAPLGGGMLWSAPGGSVAPQTRPTLVRRRAPSFVDDGDNSNVNTRDMLGLDKPEPTAKTLDEFIGAILTAWQFQTPIGVVRGLVTIGKLVPHNEPPSVLNRLPTIIQRRLDSWFGFDFQTGVGFDTDAAARAIADLATRGDMTLAGQNEGPLSPGPQAPPDSSLDPGSPATPAPSPQSPPDISLGPGSPDTSAPGAAPGGSVDASASDSGQAAL
jgi:hypothetical protein